MYKLKFYINMFWFWWMTGFFAKTILDWLSQWIVFGFLSDSSTIIVLSSALSYRASWLANEIMINSASHVDKVTEFCFLNFHEIISLFSANLKQNLLTLFLSLKLPPVWVKKSFQFQGFQDFFIKWKEFGFAWSWNNLVTVYQISGLVASIIYISDCQ